MAFTITTMHPVSLAFARNYDTGENLCLWLSTNNYHSVLCG